MLRFIFTALPCTHELLSHCLSSQFETLHIHPGLHITAQLRSSFHGPAQAEIHCGDLIWQVLGDQPAREYEKWLWDRGASAAIGSLWKHWAVRENEPGSRTARRTAGDQRAAVQLISAPYAASIGAVEHPCHPCGRKGKTWRVWRGRNYVTCRIHPTNIHGDSSITDINFQEQTREEGREYVWLWQIVGF